MQWQIYKTNACKAFDPFGMECWDFLAHLWRGLAPFVLSVNKLTSLLTCTWDVNVTSVYFIPFCFVLFCFDLICSSLRLIYLLTCAVNALRFNFTLFLFETKRLLTHQYTRTRHKNCVSNIGEIIANEFRRSIGWSVGRSISVCVMFFSCMLDKRFFFPHNKRF